METDEDINQILRSSYWNLSLANKGLSSLPESIESHTQLHSINVSGNQLSSLPEWLGALRNLRSLNASDNNLSSLPESLGESRNFYWLNFSRNRLSSLPASFEGFNELKSLDLLGNRLSSLPEWLGELKELKSLNLSGNRLSSLPESLGRLKELKLLDLSGNRLSSLPESMTDLTQLQSLSLSGNQLSSLPESMGKLAQLKSLDITGNQLSALPQSFGDLSNLTGLDIQANRFSQFPTPIAKLKGLEKLNISNNNITLVPEWIDVLRFLKALQLGGNPITSLPETIGTLSQLQILSLSDNSAGLSMETLPTSIRTLRNIRHLFANHCGLRELPDWIVEFVGLTRLHLTHNRLTSLPTTLASLSNLEVIALDENPLNPDLAAAYAVSTDAVKRHLRELSKGRSCRYEAKLLILGDGNEGKTCVSRALRDLPFREQRTTQGIDVEQWTFPHPDGPPNPEKEITLNIWDFEGQEISHQTHQFFLTSESLYLLVFKCRDQFLMDRAEYWLDTIRARAPKAKVAIVISQCEQRSPHVPLDRIKAQYGDILAKKWFFTVGCENSRNIESLRTSLKRSAADLPFMGSDWPKTYEGADRIIKIRSEENTSHITRSQLNAIFQKSGVSEDNYDGAAAAMQRIGTITQFPDCPDLREFVVLQPQWLTRAISKVMEDHQLSDDKGEMTFEQMGAIWNKAHYQGMFPIFHNCMKEFELCYDLEDHDNGCLVPLRFGYLAPAIPWTKGSGIKERRMDYKLNIRPPMGIMSRFIVKTHHMIVKTSKHKKGIYWHNGVFLRTNSPCPSEALCEFLPEDRTLRVHVRAAFPQNMCEQIHGYMQALFAFYGGLSAERSYGCIKVNKDNSAESQCSGLHTEKRIYTAISKNRTVLDCEFEGHEVDPRLLVSGISSFGAFIKEKFVTQEDLRRELDKPPQWATPYLQGAGMLLNWVQLNSEKLDALLHAQAGIGAEFKQEAELKLREYLACMSQILDDRDRTAAPGLISIITKDRSPWNPVGYFKQTYILTPYCECDGNIHVCQDASVEFKRSKSWWQATAPWIARATNMLAAGLQLGLAGMPLALGADVARTIENEVKFMQALAARIKLEEPEDLADTGEEEILGESIGKDLRSDEREAAITRAALARFLENVAPNNYLARRWGSLRRVRLPDSSYRWLCEICARRNP